MILVRRGIDHYSVLVSNLRHIETTAICINIGGRPVKLLAIYQLCDPWSVRTCRNVLGRDIDLLAGDLNAKHKDLNSKIDYLRGVLLRDVRPRIPASSMDQISLPLYNCNA